MKRLQLEIPHGKIVAFCQKHTIFSNYPFLGRYCVMISTATAILMS